MKVKTELYKNIEITYETNENNEYIAFALENTLVTFKNLYTGEGYDNITGAEKNIKKQIDKFLSITPKNYTELSEAITNYLIWTSYEECHVNDFILKVLVDNFIEYRNKS